MRLFNITMLFVLLLSLSACSVSYVDGTVMLNGSLVYPAKKPFEYTYPGFCTTGLTPTIIDKLKDEDGKYNPLYYKWGMYFIKLRQATQ